MREEIQVAVDNYSTLIWLQEQEKMLLNCSKVSLLHHLIKCFSVKSVKESDSLKISNNVGDLIMVPTLLKSVRFSSLAPELNHHNSLIFLEQVESFKVAVEINCPSWEVGIILVFN